MSSILQYDTTLRNYMCKYEDMIINYVPMYHEVKMSRSLLILLSLMTKPVLTSDDGRLLSIHTSAVAWHYITPNETLGAGQENLLLCSWPDQRARTKHSAEHYLYITVTFSVRPLDLLFTWRLIKKILKPWLWFFYVVGKFTSDDYEKKW